MKRILYVISAIYIVTALVAGIVAVNTNHLFFSKGFVKCIESEEQICLIEEGINSSVVYMGGIDGDIDYIYKSNNKIIDAVFYENLFVLAESQDGYVIGKFDQTLDDVSWSDVLKVDDEYEPVSLNVYLNTGYITAVNNSQMMAQVYEYETKSIQSSSLDSRVSDKKTAVELQSIYHMESDAGLIKNAYYDGNEIVTNSSIDVTNSENIAKYGNIMNLSFGESVKVNAMVFVVFLADIVLGVLIIVLVGNLVGMRRRFVDFILVSEIFIICGFIIMIVVGVNIIPALIWFIILSAAFIGLIIIENRDIAVLCGNMKRIGSDNFELIKPKGETNEIQTLWRGINELRQQFDKYKYNNEAAIATALKFLPKNLATLMNKASVDEIKSGDRVGLRGTMMMLKSDNELDNMSVELLEKYEESINGIMLISESISTDVRMLFSSNSKNAVQTGLSEYESILGWMTTGLFFDDNFEISVIGTDTRSFLSVDSKYLQKMDGFAKWLYKQKLSMVISEEVKKGQDISSPLRYIGYIECNGSKKKFYEVLNAYPESTRSLRLKCIGDFDAALELFYKNDFYLARTAFSDIIKTDYSDELSRWYLFICEKYLNDPGYEKPLELASDVDI